MLSPRSFFHLYLLPSIGFLEKLGAPLGRLEGRIALETLSQRLPHLRLSSHQTLAHLPNLMFRGFAQLEGEWQALA
jgi:hypothetical protein